MGTGFHLTGGEHLTQPVFCMVLQASMALWRSIRRWVIGTGDRGGHPAEGADLDPLGMERDH